MPTLLRTGVSSVVGYRLEIGNANPALFYYINILNPNAPFNIPRRYCDIIRYVVDYPQSGDLCEVRYQSCFSPCVQIPNLPEWVGAGYSYAIGINWFYEGLDFALYVG